MDECNQLLSTNVLSDSTFSEYLQADCKSLTSAVSQLLPEIDNLLKLCQFRGEQEISSKSSPQSKQVHDTTTFPKDGSDDIENTELVRTLREQLSTAHQMLTEQLPVDTKNALLETSQIVETERIQLQAEMDRRMLEFERNHNASIIELEANRRDLVKQLEEMEVYNRELKNEIFSVQQKLQAKERFLNEQTEERELEREEFRIELNRLKNELDAKKSQLMSYKLMEADDTDSCTTQLGMKETAQTNCIPNWISNMKLENLVQSESVKPSIQSFVNSKSWNTQWNKSHDSDDDSSTGNVNTSASKDQYRYSSTENNWQPYTIPPMINNSSFLDSRENTPDNNYSIRSYPDDVNKKQTTLVDDSNTYIQHELNLCDASTQGTESVFAFMLHSFFIKDYDLLLFMQISFEDEETGFKYQFAKQNTNFTNQSSVAIQTDICPAVTVDAASETCNSCEELDLIQSDSDGTTTNNRYTTRNANQPTRTTTTTRIRTFNTTAAAAVLSHVTVSEEESVVTVVDEPELSEPSPVFDNQQNSLQDQIEKYKLEIDNLRRQLEAHRKLQQNELLSIEQPKQDRDTQTLVLCRDNCMQTVKLSGSFTQYESLSLQKKHHRSLPTLHSPSFSSNAEDTGVEMSQGLVDSASVESVSLPTKKSPIVQDLISLRSDRCSSPEDENLQTVIGSPMSDKDDDMEVEIPEIILSSNQESVNPSPNAVQDANHDTLDSVAPGTLNPDSENTDDAASMVPISEVSKLIEQLTDSEILIKTLRNEIDDLTKYQVELQHDYNTVHEMLVERQNDLTRVTEQLLESEGKLKSLSSQLVERKDVLSERDEDLFLLNEDKKSLELKVTELQSEIEELRRLVKCYNSENHVLSVSVQADLPNPQAVMDDKMIQVMMMPSLIDSQYRSISDENKNMLEDSNHVLKELTIQQQQQQQENGIPQLWASSTPKEEESPNSTFTSTENDTPTKTISAELNTLTNRLREESVRLATATAIATSRQPVCERSSTILANKPISQTEEAIKVEADALSAPWMNEIRETYAHLKEAVSEVSKMVNDNTWIKKEPSDFEDAEESMRNFVNRLLVSLSKALDSDEKLWLSALTTSVDQTYAIIQNKIGVHSNLVEPLTEGILCRIIQQLTERISAFMRREDEFRKCLVEVLHVEEASFKSELKTHINRSDTLMEEINRLTQLVSSRSEELDHANNRTNELCSQLGDLKVELVHTQHELQSKSNEVDNHLTNIEHLRSQLSEEFAKTGKLRAELESLQSAKVQVEHELSSSNNLVQELKTSLSNEKSRAQTLKVELDQLYDQIKKNTHRPISRPPKEYSIDNDNNNHNSVNGNMIANENRAPTDNSCSSSSNLNRNIYQAINLATVHLASTRRDTIKLQNQVKELQTTAQALRLNLAEAELRLMPTLTSFVPDAALNHSSNGIRDPQCCIPNQVTAKKKSSVNTNQSELPSARFAKLKNVCTDLLSRVSMDEHDIHENDDEPDDDDDDDGDDDEHDQYANSSDDDSIEENIFLGTGILNPLISRSRRNNGEHDKSFSRNSGISISSTHDQTQNYTSTLDKSTVSRNKRINKVNNSNYSASNNHCQKIVDSSSCMPVYSNKLNSPIQTLPIMTTSILSSSGQIATTDQTVSVERYRSLYTRCLRAESYRRALSFQKRYLLLLLGNFQYSEDVVIANLGCPESRITPQVDSEDGFPSKFNSSPLHKFRTVGRVVQVIYRMKHLVNKWRRVGILNTPSMQSTPLNNTDSHRNSVRSNSYHITPFQSNSFNLQTDHATRTNRHLNGSSRTPLRELYTEESNNISGSPYRNSPNINGNTFLSNNSVYPPRTSLSSSSSAAAAAHAVQASPNLQSPFLDNHTVSTLASHRWRPHSSFTQSALAAAATTTTLTTTTTNPKAIPISRQVPITSIPVCTTGVYDHRSAVRNHQSSSSSSNLSIENRRRISTTTSSTFCRVDSTQTHTVRTISHSHNHHNKNQMNPIHKRSSYS
ncbi:unnamed protein product [Trichobilharzia szidati]|nr:unnamed protein product [Trichobilharzia szidati]